MGPVLCSKFINRVVKVVIQYLNEYKVKIIDILSLVLQFDGRIRNTSEQ